MQHAARSRVSDGGGDVGMVGRVGEGGGDIYAQTTRNVSAPVPAHQQTGFQIQGRISRPCWDMGWEWLQVFCQGYKESIVLDVSKLRQA